MDVDVELDVELVELDVVGVVVDVVDVLEVDVDVDVAVDVDVRSRSRSSTWSSTLSAWWSRSSRCLTWTWSTWTWSTWRWSTWRWCRWKVDGGGRGGGGGGVGEAEVVPGLELAGQGDRDTKHGTTAQLMVVFLISSWNVIWTT